MNTPIDVDDLARDGEPTLEDVEAARRELPVLIMMSNEEIVALLRKRGQTAGRLRQLDAMKQVLGCLKVGDFILHDDGSTIVEVQSRGSIEDQLRLRDEVDTRNRDVLQWLRDLEASIEHTMRADFGEAWNQHQHEPATPMVLDGARPLQTMLLLRRVQMSVAVDRMLVLMRSTAAESSAGLCVLRDGVVAEIVQLCKRLNAPLEKVARRRAILISSFLCAFAPDEPTRTRLRGASRATV